MKIQKVPYILTRRQSIYDDKVPPVEKTQRIPKYNKNQRRLDEYQKNDVKATAVILRTK